ncbi:zinc-ribbon domain-containing protein [Oceanobacillus rekensis]|uniref:zinc-ribbon domain-containing protein n=1 Tax=Oceanobacillus rekensis TaxID=937927 RepID=UPI000B43B2EA
MQCFLCLRLNISQKYFSTLKRWGSGSCICDEYIVWRCKECGHNWETQAKNRTIHHTGCPKCHERYNVGYPELANYFYFKEIFKDAQLNTIIDGIEAVGV